MRRQQCHQQSSCTTPTKTAAGISPQLKTQHHISYTLHHTFSLSIKAQFIVQFKHTSAINAPTSD